jgi:hypothetical protein
MTSHPVVKNGQDTGAEIAKDMLENAGVSFDEVRSILLLIAPLPGE